MSQAQHFFRNKNVLVQSERIKKTLSKVDSYLQAVGRPTLVVKSYRIAMTQKKFAIPLGLNMRQTLKTGTDYTLQAVGKHVLFNKKFSLKSIKNKIIEFLS